MNLLMNDYTNDQTTWGEERPNEERLVRADRRSETKCRRETRNESNTTGKCHACSRIICLAVIACLLLKLKLIEWRLTEEVVEQFTLPDP